VWLGLSVCSSVVLKYGNNYREGSLVLGAKYTLNLQLYWYIYLIIRYYVVNNRISMLFCDICTFLGGVFLGVQSQMLKGSECCGVILKG